MGTIILTIHNPKFAVLCRMLGESAPLLTLTSTLLAISQLARISPDYYPLIEQAGVLPQVP